MMLQRIVSNLTDLDSLIEKAGTLIDEINDKYDFYFTSFDETRSANSTITWTCLSTEVLQIFLKFEASLNIGYLDIYGPLSDHILVIEEEFIRSKLFENQEFFLKRAEDSTELSERVLVQLSFASVADWEDISVIEIIETAFKSKYPNIRRAASYGTLILVWEKTNQLNKEALKNERNPDVRKFMEFVQEQVSSAMPALE